MLCSLVLAMSGCYSYELRKPAQPPIDAFGPVADGGQICVLRPHWNASAVTAIVHDNGQLVGATRGPTYFCYAAAPGHHAVESKADTTERADVDVAPGGRYYLHQIVDNIFGVVRTRLAWLREDEAALLVDKCGYRELVAVPGSERLPTGGPVPAAVAMAGTAAR
jgi:hypothetical protein